MIRLPKWFVVVLALALVAVMAMPAVAAEPAKGKVKSVAADNSEFTITDSNNKDWTFRLAADARILIGDKEGKISDLKTGDSVSLLYNKDGNRMTASAVLINQGGTQTSDITAGTVKSVSADKDEFTLTDAANKEVTFHLGAGSKVRLNDKDSKLNDLKVGDHIALIYEKKGDQMMVREIACNRK